MSMLILVGYWAEKGDAESEYPDVTKLINHDWDPLTKQKVVDFLKKGVHYATYRGMSRCRITGNWNGASELTDGTYVWPSGLVHYVETYDVRLPDEFINHVLVGGSPRGSKERVDKQPWKDWASTL